MFWHWLRFSRPATLEGYLYTLTGQGQCKLLTVPPKLSAKRLTAPCGTAALCGRSTTEDVLEPTHMDRMTYQDHLKELSAALAAARTSAQAAQAALGNHEAMTAALDAHGAALDNALTAAEAAADALKKENDALVAGRRPWWCWCG